MAKKKESFKGSKKYGIKHTENPTGKVLISTAYGVMGGKIKNYSRNTRGK